MGGGHQVKGHTEAGATVVIKDENGNTIGTGTADQNGDFNIEINPPKTNGETLTAEATDKAGNTSAPETVKADDTTPPNKPTNLDVSDDGSHVSGKAEPGTTVTIRDENGNTIGTGTADQNGNFDISVNPPKTNGETLTAEATDGAGNTSLAGTVKADDTTKPNAPTLTDDSQDQTLNATDDTNISGSAPDAKDGTATLVDAAGNPVKDSAGNPITAPIDDNGNFTLPAAGVPDGDYGVQVKDEAGNPSTGNAPISIDRTVPKITSVEFADNNNPSGDNQLTRNEIGTDGKTWINVNFDKTTVKVDDVIKVNGVEHKITAADITAGQAQVEIPVDVAPGSQGTLDVTAQITDTAGNQSNVVDNSIAVNRAADGIPRVEYIDDGANGGSKNGTLTAAEISGDGTVTTTARIVLPGNLEDGDTVSIPDLSNTPYTVNGNKVGDFSIGTNEKGEKYIEVQVPVAEDATSLTTPVVVTVDGTDLSATGNIKVDTVAPQSAPELTVEGVTPTDTTINAAEAKDGLDLKVTIPQGTQEGDHIIIKDGATTLLDRPLTKEEAESDEISLNIAAPANGTTVNLTATVKEPREDGIAKTSDPVTATVDTAIPGGADANGDGLGDAAPVITFTQDTQPEDGKLNAAELNGQKAAVTIEVPTDVAINDTLVYTVNGGTEQTVNITAAVKENGFTVPADQLPATGTITVKAYVKDAAGNRSAEAEEVAKIDTSIAKPTPTAGTDGSVNIALPSDAEKGDTVKVEYNDEAGNPQTVTLTKGDDGWTSDKPELIAHPTGDTATIPEDGVRDNTPVTITAKDTAGNTSSADPFKAPDVTAPSYPQPSANDDGSVKLELPTDANPGDKVEVTVIPEGGTAENPTKVTLEKQPDGTWKSDKTDVIPSTTVNNKDTTTIPENQVKDGSTVTAVATDGTNSSDPKTTDAKDTRTPMLSLTGQSEDKVLGKGEGNSITGKVTYDSTGANADTAEGATVILKNAQGEQVATKTAAADGTFTFASVADGTYSIEVTSASGKTGAPITDVLVDHLAPAAQDITLANDTAGASTTDNISKDGTLVIPTLGDGESIKSVTVNGTDVPVVNGKYVLNPGEYAAESIKVVVKDAAGHETESTNSKAITIDTTAPDQPAIASQTNGSVNITLPTENVKTGDTVEVKYTDESGVKQTVTFTKGADGWTSDKPTLIANPTDNIATIPAASVQDGSEVTAVAKDPAGNENTAKPQNAGNNPDTTAPDAPTLKPNADGTMDVGLPTNAKPGDQVKVIVTPDGATQPTEVTLTKKDDGTWESNKPNVIPDTTADNKNTTTIPENQVKDGSEVKATATDPSGNTSDETKANANDTRTPVVDLNGDSDDNVLSATDGKDITGTVTYGTDANADKAEGAKVELFNAQGAKVGEKIADKDGNFTFEDVADGTYSIKVSSASGKPGTGVDKIVVDHGVPGDTNVPLDGISDQAPSVVFVDDKNPKDNVLTRNEVGSDGKVKVDVTLPNANVNEGDTVVLIINGNTDNPVTHTITAAEAESHKATIEIPVGTIGAETQQDLTVSAKVVDAVGQSSKEGSSTIPVDRTVNGTPSIEYVEDTGATVNGKLVGKEDGILWTSENLKDNNVDSTTVKVNLPKGIGGLGNSDDVVTITINGTAYTLADDKESVTADGGAATYAIHRPSATDSFDPYVEIPVATTSISEIKAKVEVSYTKANGTAPTTVGTEDVILTIDSAVPGGDSDNNNQGDETGKPFLTIAEATDGVNADELSDGKVEAQVELPEGVQKGDHIILRDANNNVLADVQVDADKAKGVVVTVDIPKAKLSDGDYKVTAIVKEDGTNGRESLPSNEVELKVDTNAPSAPGLTATPNGGVDITLPADAQKGDTVEVKYFDENGNEKTVTLTKGDNGWTSDTKDVIPDSSTNQVTLPANQVKDGTTVTATASDGVNPSASNTATVNDTRVPVITLTDESADHKLVKGEGNTITGTVEYSDGDSAEAATVTLVNAQGETKDTATVEADGTFKFENVADGVYTVKASNGDKETAPQTVTVDRTPPVDAGIKFTTDSGDSNTDKISKDGLLTITPASDATIVPDSVKYSTDGENWQPVPKDADGNYELPVGGPYQVQVQTKDNVDNITTTTVSDFVVDKTPPADATIKLTEDTGESKTDNISKEGGLTITPANDATIQKVEYQDATTGAWKELTGPAYTLPAGTYAANAIKVTTVDTAGNPKETFNTDPITVDKTPPTKGTVAIAKDTGTLGTDGITNDGTLVTPTLGEGEKITSVTVKGEALLPNAEGKYILPEDTYAIGDIKVTVVDKAGNETVSDNNAAITVDKTQPTEPSVTTTGKDGDGSVTVGLPTNANAGDTVEVKYTDENGVDQTVTLTKGQNDWTTSPATLPTGVTLNGNTLTIGEDAVKDGTPVNAKSIDVAGNEKAATAANAGNDALSNPPTVTVAEAQDGYVNKADLDNGGLTGTTTNAPDGSTIKLLDKDGKPVDIGTVTVTDNKFTIPANKVPEGDYTITVTTPAADGGKTSAPTPLFTVDTKVTAPSLSTTGNDGDGSVTVGLPGDAKVGDKVEVSVTPEGAAQPVTVTLEKQSDGTWKSDKPAVVPSTTTNNKDTTTIPENAVKDGSTVTAKSVDTADNEAEASPTATAGSDALAANPKVTVGEAADGYVNKTELDDGGLTGTTENAPNGSKVELLDEEGTPVDIGTVTVTDNKFTIPANKVPNNGKYTIKVTTPEADGAKEVSTSAFTVDVTTPTADVTAKDNGSVEIALPTNPVLNDKVEVTYTKEGASASTTATLTYNGSAWISTDSNIQVSGNTATIAADKVKDDTDVSATASDAAGNTQAEQSSDHVPATPVITVDDVTNGINATELANGISGTVANAPTGTQVQLYKGDTKVGSPVEVGEGGKFSIPNTNNVITDADNYTVKLVGQENTVASTPFKVDATKPVDATITFTTDSGVSGDKISNDGHLTITPASDATIVSGSVKYSTDGENWTSVPVVNDKYKLPADGTYQVQVQTQDTAGNIKETTVSGFVVDTAVPQATIDAKDDGSVEITLPTNPVLNDKVEVTYTKEGASASTTATLTYNGSAWISTDSNIQVSGNTATIAADKVKDDTDVSATASDAAGNRQDPASTDHVPVTVDNTNSVTAVVDQENGATVSGTTDPNSTVTITNAKGEVVGTATADNKGDYTATLTRTVTAQDADRPNQTFSIDTNNDGEVDTEVTTDAQGNFSYTVNNPIVTGEQLDVISIDPSGNRATAAPVTPDKIAPTAPVIAISDDGTTITGTAEPESKITLTVKDSNGTPMTGTPYDQTITVGDNGTFTVDLSANPLTDKETVTATAKDEAGNVSSPSNEVVAPLFNDNLPDVTIALAKDTGVSASDNITNIGDLKFALSGGTASGEITKVEYKDAEGNYHEVPQQYGTYVLPEGVYAPDSIRVTVTDANGAVKLSTNNTQFEVDTTSPAAASAENVAGGDVKVTLPADAKEGEYVEILVGSKKATFTSDGNGGWTPSADNAVTLSPDNNGVITLSKDVYLSGTQVAVQSFDIAGNKSAVDNDSVILNPNELTVVLKNPSINTSLSNDKGDGILLNTAEISPPNNASASSVDVRIYLPTKGEHAAQVGDRIATWATPEGGTPVRYNFTSMTVKQEDLDRGYFLLNGNDLPFQGIATGTNTFTAKLFPAGTTTTEVTNGTATVKTDDSLIIYSDKLTPAMPTISSQADGAGVEVGLPSGALTNFDGGASTGNRADVGDWVIITARGETVKVVKTGATTWAFADGIQPEGFSIQGEKVIIAQDSEKFPVGSEVTAQAFDPNGNQSALNTGHLVADPLVFQDFRILNNDIIPNSSESYTQGLNTNDGNIRYEVKVTGQEDKDALIQVQLVDNQTGVKVGNPQYIDITADKTTYQGQFTGLVADGKSYRIDTSIVNKSDLIATTLGTKSQAFTLDNVAPVITSIRATTDGNSVVVSATDGSNAIRVDNSGNYETLIDEKTITFGSVTDPAQKTHTIVDAYGNKTVINNPKYDWLMRYDDDNASDSSNAKDHASGWSNSGRWFTWNGSDTAADTIIAAHVQTDESYKDSWKQGLIGTEDGYMGWVHAFDVNTRGGGGDYIQSHGIAGYTRIWTNDGDDTIVTDFMIGAANTFLYGDFDGSSQIYMGSGNDTFTVKGTFNEAYTNGDFAKDGWAGMFHTNAKIDMGDGDDKVEIWNGIWADKQSESGNYINLGAGNDTMVSGTISSDFANWEGSNIINLGTGHDTLTVNGNIESDSGDRPARFMLYSEDSSKVTVTDDVRGRSAMLMGNGNDDITIGNLQVFEGDNELSWLSDVFNHAAEADHYGYYGASFYGDLSQRVNAALNRSNAIDDSTGGNLRLHNGGVAARFDLGNGENTFWVKGMTEGARIVGGDGVDHINLGTDPSNINSGGINPTASVHNTLIGTGKGNDTITLVKMKDDNYVNSGEGDDTVEIHGISGIRNVIDTGAGNDTVRIYGAVASDIGIVDSIGNANHINLGDGQDTLLLGANSNNTPIKLYVSNEVSLGYSQLLGAEEIAFNGTGTTVRVGTELGKDKVAETLFIHNTANGSNNKVELDNGWTKFKENVDYQQGYKVTEYHSGEDILYVQQGITIL